MTYQVADYLFEVVLPQGMEAEVLLPSFRDFVYSDHKATPLLFCFDTTAEVPEEEKGRLLEESVNDMGCVRVWQTERGYIIEARHERNRLVHRMYADREFHHIAASMLWDDTYAGQMLCSMIRIVYSQAVLREKGISIHASAVAHDGKGYLFMGKSGTGKSTHANLWLQHIPGTERINDDNPTIRIVEGKAYVYGTPWSGKTPCYRNICYPIGGIARLRQAPHNRFRQLNDVEAFMALLPGCMVTGYGLQVTGYGLRVTGYGLQVTGYRLRVTGYGLQVTGYGLQVTGYGLQVTGLLDKGTSAITLHPISFICDIEPFGTKSR